MSDATFEEMQSRCKEVGAWLLKPRGLRKYYYLSKAGTRIRLGKSWGEAQWKIDTTLRQLAKQQEAAVGTDTSSGA